MRWDTYGGNKSGDIRRVTKFLWSPKKVVHQTRWLEYATRIEMYKVYKMQ